MAATKISDCFRELMAIYSQREHVPKQTFLNVPMANKLVTDRTAELSVSDSPNVLIGSPQLYSRKTECSIYSWF